MAKMRAVMAAVQVMEKEGITQAFGVPAQRSTQCMQPCANGNP